MDGEEEEEEGGGGGGGVHPEQALPLLNCQASIDFAPSKYFFRNGNAAPGKEES